MNTLKYNLINRSVSASVLEVAYIRDEIKIRYIIENAGASNVVRVEGRIVGQSTWDLLLDITGTDNQLVDVATYEEVQVSVLTYDSLSNYVDIIGSSFDNVDSGLVDSVNGQVGVVVISAIDVPYDDTITGYGLFTVQETLDQLFLDGEGTNTALSAHIGEAVGAHAASAISVSPQSGISSIEVQAALEELSIEIQDHITETVGAHAASAISNIPSGNLSATEVQAALNELQTDVDTRTAGPASSVDGEVALFDGVTGKLLKSATGTGFATLTAGVLSTSATVNAATELTGITPVANGGTGASTLTLDNLIVGNGTSPVTFIAPGALNNVLKSNGTTFTSSPLALDDLSNVTVPAPSATDFLGFNGTNWVNQPISAVSANRGVILFPDDTFIIDEYGSMPASPTVVPTDTNTIIVPAGTTVFSRGYLYDYPINDTLLSSGIWQFNFYTDVDDITGTSQLGYDIFKVMAGAGTATFTGAGTTRTVTTTSSMFVAGDANADQRLASYVQTPIGTFQITAFTSATQVDVLTDAGYINESAVTYTKHVLLFGADSGDINSTSIVLITTPVVQPSFVIDPTDKLALRVYGIASTSRTINFYINGTTTYSHIITTLSVNHNDIAGIQGGNTTERYHLTLAEHTIATQAASATLDGYLLSTDWNRFNDLIALSGVPANSTDLGTFTGTTIPDNSTIKQALQSLETFIGGTSVNSVNGQTGIVVLDSDDIAEGITNLYFTDERVDDRVAALIVAGTGITSVYSDAGNTLTISTTITQYTDEMTQDAVGTILTDSNTIDFTYNDGAPSIVADVRTQMSITSDASGIKLVNDATTPGNTYYYGTDGAGVKGFFPISATGSAGDLAEMSFSLTNNQVTPADVTGFLFPAGTVRSFSSLTSVEIDATADLYEQFTLQGINKAVTFDMSQDSVGDASGVVFSITSTGQVQYISANYSGFVSGIIKFRAITTTV